MTKIHVSTIQTSIASLGCQVTITDLPVTVDVPCVVNVSRRQETILYRSNSKQTAHIGYVKSQQPFSTSNLYIVDRSSTLIANRIATLDEPINVESVITYLIPTDKFIVTDIYAADDNANTSAALFYKHVISTVNLIRITDSDTISSTNALVSVELLDVNFVPISIDAIKIDYDKGLVYNNLLSAFDQSTGEVTAYYIRYSVRNPVGSILSFTELVSNVPVFNPADYSDLDSNFVIIDDGRKVYLVESQDDTLRVKLPHSGNYSFQLLEDAKVQLIPPPQADINDPWYVSVSNGKFSTLIDGQPYQYSVPEFGTQAWDPYYPFKSSQFENSNFVSAKLVKLNRTNINTDTTQSGHVSLLIYDKDDVPVAAFTTYTGLTGLVAENSELYQTWTNVERTGIRSVDAREGLVDLDGIRLRSDYRILGSYLYNESAYEVTAIDFNPFRNPDIRAKTVSFFVKPSTSSDTLTQAIYYTMQDASGKVIKSNLDNFDDTDQKIRTSDDIWRSAYAQSVPSYVTTDSGAITFVPTYTVIGSGLFLPLGDVSVSEDSSPERSTFFDTRIRGGGIKEGKVGIAKYLQREVKWYWDLGFWDGTPYPGNASYFIEVPVDVLEVAGGVLKSDQVRDVIDRHTAAGVYAIAKAYGIDPEISGVDISDSTVSIAWRSYEV